MMPLGEAFYRRKVAEIQAELAYTHAETGLLLLDPHNVVYATGFVHSPSERPIGCYIPASGDPVLFIPLLEQENAAATWIGDIRTYFEYPGEIHPIEWMIREAGVERIGVDTLPAQLFATMTEPLTLMTQIERLRQVKSAEEIALTEQAARYADFCLETVLATAGQIVRAGGTELDILAACLSATLDKMQREIGAQYGRRGLKVVGTVHSGPRAALPHGEPSARTPQPGEPLIAGIGAMVGGYHAESGATFLLGEPQGDQMRCLQAAVACDQAAVAALRPGATCAAVNAAALAVLRDYGLEEAIRHRIGHGMGLQGHESPWLAPGDVTIVQPNMVFSNEPGIYRPEIDGYRTINTMIATDGEARVVSRFLAEHSPEERIIPL
ncbi:MAG: aminopeptidase P family protein [Chloroflexi bacterium]|nr:aminopeptidase P family protein [Chloroflexota bacterium]